MADFPNSYKDPTYAALDAQTEKKLELPPGLLSAIRTRGEKSDHDEVSSAKATGVYQFIPATQKAILNKYGIDVSLSPENASQGAGLLLKEGLDRNAGNVKLAVAEYTGGLDRANWGPTTKAYVQRVTGSPLTQAPKQSTFDRVSAQMSKPADSSMANVYQAYQSGQMTPEESAAFEKDVSDGHVMLPRGASLKTAAPASDALPASVLEAYRSGQMPAADKAQLESDVKDGLVKLPAGQSLSLADQIPGQAPGVVAPAATDAVDQTPQSFGQQMVGAGETGLALATGAIAAPVGIAAGTIKGLAGAVMNGSFGTPEGANAVEQSAAAGASAVTYQPRTVAGQQQMQAIAPAMNELMPLAGISGELAGAHAGAAPVAAAARDATAAVRGAVPEAGAVIRNALSGSSERVKTAMGLDSKPTAGTQGSVGAAGTDMATQRRQTAESLPVPIQLTEGQATRDQPQLRFEQETAKDAVGAPLREHFADQNQKLPQNFEALIDATGAEKGGVPIEAGRVVDEALVGAAAKAKAEYRVKYKDAEKAGEMQEPVSLQPLADYLNSNRAGRTSAPILNTIAEELKVQGIGDGALADGSVVAGDATLSQAEALRKAVNKFAKNTDPNDLRVGSEIKGVIDQITDGKGGDLYQQARKARQRYAQLFEDNAVVSDLLKSRKGSSDRQVALENVFRRTILNGSREDLSNLRRTLHSRVAGDAGHQAWSELQGATIRNMLEEATSGVGTDINGNPIFSAAKLNGVIKRLEQGGKLDFILSKKGAQQIRDINELAKVIYTTPPGTVNTSNTAGVIMAALAEAGVTGSLIGLPVPVVSGLKMLNSHVKDRQVKVRIAHALGQAPNKAPPPRLTPAPQPRAIH